MFTVINLDPLNVDRWSLVNVWRQRPKIKEKKREKKQTKHMAW